jgi:hypothetical protein
MAAPAALLATAALLAAIGCKAAPKPPPSQPQVASFSNSWLAGNVQIEVSRAAPNPQSGLFEVDATIQAPRLQQDRAIPYRLVARTRFFEGSRSNNVDTSAWAEIVLQPGEPVRYSCTSLRPAEDYMIELAYPEEVGIR